MARPEQVSFLLLVGAIPVMQPFNVALLGMVVTPADGLFLVTVALLCLSWWRGHLKLRFGRFSYFLLAYLLALLVSVVFAQDPARGLAKLTANLYLLGLCLLAYSLTLEPAMRRRPPSP